jgi:hypothetical protein
MTRTDDIKTAVTAVARHAITAPIRGKVVRLAVGKGVGPMREGRASHVTLDIQGPIDDLRSLRSDLELYYWNLPPDGPDGSARFQVGLWMRLVGDRIAALEAILMHKGSRQVLVAVDPATAEPVEHLHRALHAWIPEDRPLAEVQARVADILRAADAIALTAGGGAGTGGGSPRAS